VPRRLCKRGQNCSRRCVSCRRSAATSASGSATDVEPLADSEAHPPPEQSRHSPGDCRRRAHEVPARGKRFFLGMALLWVGTRVVWPFIDKEIPVEYALGEFDCHGQPAESARRLAPCGHHAKLMARSKEIDGRNRARVIIEELQKQYDVVQVDPTNRSPREIRLVLAVSPSRSRRRSWKTSSRS